MSAVEGLANLDDVRALDAALKYGAYGNPDRSRGTAIRAASKLAHHDRDRVIAWLLPMLSDPHRRPWRSAGSALAELKEEKAIEPLERIAASHPDPDRRSAATAWIEEIRGGEETGPPRRGGRSER